MITALISGVLIGKPALRTSRNGNPFVTCQARTTSGDESFLVSLVAFDDSICKALMALDKGDSLSVTESAKPTTWPGRDGEPCLGLSVKVEQLMTQYSLTKKRAAAQGDKTRYGLPARSPLLEAEGDTDDHAPF